jgi:hypothetical protein
MTCFNEKVMFTERSTVLQSPHIHVRILWNVVRHYSNRIIVHPKLDLVTPYHLSK